MLLITNANIATMNRAAPRATAAVVMGDYFAYVGDEAGARSFLAGREAPEVLDAGGRLMLPGFNDSHMHYLHYVKAMRSVDLVGSASVDEVVERMQRGLASCAADQWLVGEGWNQDYFTGEQRFPTADDLDRVSREHPVVIMRACFHIGVLNTRAMELLELDAGTAERFGELAEHRADGSLNGVVKEQMFDWLKTRIPAPKLDELVQMMCDGQESLFRLGITSVQTDDYNYSPQGQFEPLLFAMRDAAQAGRLKLRTAQQALVTTQQDLEGFLARGFDDGFYGHRSGISAIKLLADGSLGARTAYMRQPFKDDPGNCGLPTYTQAEMDKLVATAHRHNMAVIIHAIGDAAIDMCLNAIQKARESMPHLHPRHGIVHCQITAPEHPQRFAELDVVAYTQPVFMNHDMHIVYDRVGQLGDSAYAWGDFQKLGVHQAFGTDCPVEAIAPLPGIYNAVTRRDTDGAGPYLPEQALPVEDCLYNYTAAGAYCSGEEHIKGQIRPGHLADFIFFDRDLTTVPPEELLKAQVLATYLAGRCVWRDNTAWP